MKMDPITFRTKYSTHSTQDGVVGGFVPFRDTNGEWIYACDVTLQAGVWHQGSMVTFCIELWASSEIRGNYRRQVCERAYFDKDHRDFQELFLALAYSELRGHTAELAADRIFCSLFLHSDEMKQYLPNVISEIDRLEAAALARVTN